MSSTLERRWVALSAALERTQAWLGLPVDADRWLGRLYQSANRLAHLYFLREVAGIDAWLAHACFLDDTDHVPIPKDAWRRGLEDADRELGLAESSPFAGAAFLVARHISREGRARCRASAGRGSLPVRGTGKGSSWWSWCSSKEWEP